ncbi:probable DNA mismatch repair protein Msh6 [Tribolium castaneum]|uniref:probable DNA mismatch repair protein Msh6 n=1 Tax=Tribolium castaneum TaxID=7070 RepID=UPI0030FF2354
MSKRFSTGQSNTLLNYFQSPKSSNGKDVKQNGAGKRDLVSNKDEGDVFPVQAKKRKKTTIIDSDSDDEHLPIQPTPKKSKNGKKRPVSDSDSESSDSDSKPAEKSLKLSASKTNEKSAAKAAPIVSDLNTNWLHNRLDFLQPNKIRDVNKRRPDDPDYDPRTLYIPQSFLEKQTPAMRQWWVLKSTHMDSVLFFKVGKFYELYHMDAVVGVTQLGFSYMKGEFAHSGFPESAYHKMANALIEKGFKVARTEQTETPEMMAERCKKQGRATKFDKVVNREICQISTKATCVYTAQLPDAMHSQSCYMYAIAEKDVTGSQRRFGICFIDTSIGVFKLAEFDDDKHCSKLLVCLSEYPPGLILTERKKLSSKLKLILNTNYRDVRRESLAPESQFYGASTTIEKLLNGNYFRNESNDLCLPEVLKNVTDGYNAKPEFELMVKALGGCLWYLHDSKLDIQVVSLGKFEIYQPLEMNVREKSPRSCMILDSVTIVNLNLLGEENSLQKTLDYCQTAFGKRLLTQWICRPLCVVEKIKERQEAVQELVKNTSLLKDAQDVLKKLPDLERQLAKIHTYGNKFFAQDHPDSRAVFYEAATYSKRRIGDLLKTLQGFELAQNLCPLFKGCQSSLLKRLTQFKPDGHYVDLTELLLFFKHAFDQEEAQKEGKIIPKPGVDENYDQAQDAIKAVAKKLDEYLVELQQFFGCKVTYFGSDKKRFQIDIPESHTKKVTSEYQLEGTKKGAKPSKRYSTARSRQLLAEMMKAESERAKVIQDLNRRIFQKFSEKREQWEQAIDCITVLDVLCSLAQYACNFGQDICIPEIEPMGNSDKIVIENGRHPCITNIDNFVPNDTKMGVADFANILLITGPNMGGKSTLMRQIAIICIMAHMGGYVPASGCTLSLIDRIFTRLGAHDDIVQGQSTFLVELSEAAVILHHATPHSLVLLDELGRGTSTHDGNAIATAYVEKLTTINCRTLFSTHYHSLVDHFEARRDVQLGHMACMVENDDDPTEESVTFLYKMARGRCPKSYGFNVARLSGLKHCIVSRGREISKQLENESKSRQVFRDLFTSSVATIRSAMSKLSLS